MKQNPHIRIIKRDERERQSEAQAAKQPASVGHIAQEKARDAATTITGWINKWQQEKHQNGISALLKLSSASIISKEASPDEFMPERAIRKARRYD